MAHTMILGLVFLSGLFVGLVLTMGLIQVYQWIAIQSMQARLARTTPSPHTEAPHDFLHH